MSSLVLTLTETLRYRGSIGQWSWVLHRITGLGVVFFLTLHVIDTSWSVFYPQLYVEAIATYQSPLFTIGEFGLVAAVVYHAINGVRIVLLDYRPRMWKYQRQAAFYVLGITVVILIPTFVIMFGAVLNFYSGNGQVLGLLRVLTAQIPFVAGFVVAIIAALIFGGIITAILPKRTAAVGVRPQGSRLEKFWWSYMRISGVIILPLVFGHLGMQHLIQGVFDITSAGHGVVGTNLTNVSGTSVEYVFDRWSMLVAGVAIWRLYDVALLALTVIHGFNGLRYVLTDYTMASPWLRRSAVYLCVIASVILLVVGGAAVLSTINQSALDIATQAAQDLHR
ncbi:MAG: succinate dehydrogenase, cytochrome b556 subunit [Chloroflexota bacterium]